MLKDITLGQYYPTESVIHRLDPRVKLVSTLMYIVSLFLFHDFVGFIVVTLFLIAIIRMSHVPFSFMLKGVRAIWLLVVITAVCNLFFTQGAQTQGDRAAPGTAALQGSLLSGGTVVRRWLVKWGSSLF